MHKQFSGPPHECPSMLYQGHGFSQEFILIKLYPSSHSISFSTPI